MHGRRGDPSSSALLLLVEWQGPQNPDLAFDPPNLRPALASVAAESTQDHARAGFAYKHSESVEPPAGDHRSKVEIRRVYYILSQLAGMVKAL